MKKIILWMLAFTGFIYALIGLHNSSEQEILNKKVRTQILIDSLHLHIDSLQNELNKSIDTIQYESIDTTVIHWPWGREEFYYFKYSNINKETQDWTGTTQGELLSALIFVESSGNDSAYCKHEDAVGCLQIRQTMVDDINRILKKQKSTLRFTYNDRWSRNKSTQMLEIYCKYYRLMNSEEIARCWNGGPRGINNPSTVGYWKKVINKINS